MELRRFLEDPLLWLNVHLREVSLWEKQEEMIRTVSRSRKTFVKSCHGIGKTFCAANVVLWYLYTHYPAIVISTAPSWTQVEKLLWAEINRLFRTAKYKLPGLCGNVGLKIEENWYALGVSPKMDNADDVANRIAGFHSKNVLVVIDEAPSVPQRIWDALDTVMTGEGTRLLAIGNPVKDSGPFFEGFRDSASSKISMNVFDTPNFKANDIKDVNGIAKLTDDDMKLIKTPMPMLTSVRWARERLKKWGRSSPLFMSRVLAEFPRQATDTVIPLALLEAAEDPRGLKGTVIGADIARYGDDNTVIIAFRDGRQVSKEVYNGKDLSHTTGKIMHLAGKLNAERVVIDDTGLGGGVTDAINEQDPAFDVIPVNFSEASSTDEYEGIVTEMYFNVRELLESGQVLIEDDGEMFAQLSGRKYRMTSKGKIRLESKDDYKKRVSGNSPDEADAVVLALWGYRAGSSGSDLDGADGAVTGKMYE